MQQGRLVFDDDDRSSRSWSSGIGGGDVNDNDAPFHYSRQSVAESIMSARNSRGTISDNWVLGHRGQKAWAAQNPEYQE